MSRVYDDVYEDKSGEILGPSTQCTQCPVSEASGAGVSGQDTSVHYTHSLGLVSVCTGPNTQPLTSTTQHPTR